MKHKLFIAVAILFFVISCEMMSNDSTPTNSLLGVWVVENSGYKHVFRETKYYEHDKFVTTNTRCDIMYTGSTYTTSNCVYSNGVTADGETVSYSIEGDTLTITSPGVGVRNLIQGDPNSTPFK